MKPAEPEPIATIALVSGLGTTARLWEKVVNLVDPRTEFLVFELPGHGGQAFATGFVIEDLASSLVDSLPKSRIPTIVVGHSMGGAIALEMVRRDPRRFSGLGMVCSSDRFGDKDGWREHTDQVRARGLSSLAENAPDGWFTETFRAASSDEVRAFMKDLVAVHPSSYVACCDALAAYDGRGHLDDVTCAITLIGARQDLGTPAEHMREMARGVAAASYYEIDGSHLAPVETPGPIASALNALSRSSGREAGTRKGARQ